MAATIKKGLDEQSSDDTALVIGKYRFLAKYISSHVCMSLYMQLVLAIWIMGLVCLKEWDTLMVDDASSPAGISAMKALTKSYNGLQRRGPCGRRYS